MNSDEVIGSATTSIASLRINWCCDSYCTAIGNAGSPTSALVFSPPHSCKGNLTQAQGPSWFKCQRKLQKNKTGEKIGQNQLCHKNCELGAENSEEVHCEVHCFPPSFWSQVPGPEGVGTLASGINASHRSTACVVRGMLWIWSFRCTLHVWFAEWLQRIRSYLLKSQAISVRCSQHLAARRLWIHTTVKYLRISKIIIIEVKRRNNRVPNWCCRDMSMSNIWETCTEFWTSYDNNSTK